MECNFCKNYKKKLVHKGKQKLTKAMHCLQKEITSTKPPLDLAQPERTNHRTAILLAADIK